jgi:hypothetical protein
LKVATELKEIFSSKFIWQKMDAPFEFYQLISSDFKQAALTLSCFQQIVSDSSFSLEMYWGWDRFCI